METPATQSAEAPEPAAEKEHVNPAQLLFTQFLQALREVELPEVYRAKLSARLTELKPELPSDDFQRFIAHLRSYSAATAQLSEMEASINDMLLDLIADKVTEYSALQMVLDTSAQEAEAIARQHPEWFDAAKTKSRTVTTPYGIAKMHASSALQVEDEAKSLELLESAKAQKAIGKREKKGVGA